jgi:hypothetical protein
VSGETPGNRQAAAPAQRIASRNVSMRLVARRRYREPKYGQIRSSTTTDQFGAPLYGRPKGTRFVKLRRRSARPRASNYFFRHCRRAIDRIPRRQRREFDLGGQFLPQSGEESLSHCPLDCPFHVPFSIPPVPDYRSRQPVCQPATI